MSFFIRLPNPTAAGLRSTAPLYMNGDAGTSDQPCIYGAPATAAQLDDNTAKGANFRLDAVLVTSSPPTYAFFTQARGVSQWLSYDPKAATLGFAEGVGPSQTFKLELVNYATRQYSIFNPHHNVYITMRESGGQYCLCGSEELTEAGRFVMDSNLGTGPLMPGRRYFIKTIFGTQLQAKGTTLAQTTADGPAEELYVEAVEDNRLKFLYRFRTSSKLYVSVTPEGVVELTEDGTSKYTIFQLTATPLLLGNFQIKFIWSNRALRADVDTDAVTTADPITRLSRDTFGFQTVFDGADAKTGKRAVHVSVCSRTHRGIRGDDEPKPSELSKRAVAPLKPAILPPAAAAAVPTGTVLESHEEMRAIELGIAKAAMPEPQAEVAVARRSLFASKWLLIGAALVFVAALLLGAQLVVSHNGGHFLK